MLAVVINSSRTKFGLGFHFIGYIKYPKGIYKDLSQPRDTGIPLQNLRTAMEDHLNWRKRINEVRASSTR